MTRWHLIAAVSASLLLTTVVAARDSVNRFRLAPDPANGEVCHALDDNLALLHTVTVEADEAHITSRGAIEGRMKAVRPGVYEIAFELEGRRLDVIADVSGPPKRLIVSERGRPCRWSASPQ